MAELTPLAEELSCSICLEPFKVPVTTPCGHNFCSLCLDETWAVQGAPYGCPQCRAVYQTRPQLNKNTVLCAVVEQFLSIELAREVAPDDWTPPTRPEASSLTGQVACDHCLKAAATKTCLVCMASFCQEHLRPHFDSPVFRDHSLQPPIRDLMRRKCSQHNRLREFFCPEHGECICHICVVDHKACSPAPLNQASTEMETKLRQKLAIMFGQINGASKALEDVRARQHDMREIVNRKIDVIRQEYMEVKAFIDATEANSIRKIKEEEKRVSNKFDNIFQILLKKKNEIQTLKEEIEAALTKGDEFEFLERASKVQGISTKPVYVPKVELNHELMKSVYQDTVDLKTELKQHVRQSQEKKPEDFSSTGDPGEHAPNVKPKMKKAPMAAFASPKPNKTPAVKPPEPAGQEAKAAVPQVNAIFKAKALEVFLTKSRSELLEYAAKVILDFNSAHNKVILSENYTTASVAETPNSYRPHPQRFTYCSQVLGLNCYKRGVHYWEVELQKNNFCGVGICYGTMDRQGPESRLGRNSTSWCVEWFNTKISAWHNNVEKTLPTTKATKIGILLNCDFGFVIFFAVSDKIHLLYKYKVDFTEALYPAFWLFSVGATLSICPLE
ncbi:PREDICTED: E3 ubiquitin/ISG15 ligase TRIM25 [Chrysochloris asiatica]|uniref:E3 ubiquitin/ISG15 ligase TRIM25 n=1 Tax=Chrysochloris asiatica TaxID=185453 RepID=A0A9B0WG61_CHRAS|nr:PREDICTED: E3 ubiquitin/ISG15 ligase TRIM25 [Chrysochloris asiatica]